MDDCGDRDQEISGQRPGPDIDQTGWYTQYVTRARNEQRPKELLAAIRQYVLQHGFSGLSLRPLAKAVGTSPRVLLYYFGSKEELVGKIFSSVREWQTKTLLATEEGDTFGEMFRRAWREVIRPNNIRGLQLFFEAYGLALRDRRAYKGFLDSSFYDWIDRLAVLFADAGFDRQRAEAMATLMLSGLRGFALDYCATRDRARIEAALEIWIEAMEAQIAAFSQK